MNTDTAAKLILFSFIALLVVLVLGFTAWYGGVVYDDWRCGILYRCVVTK